VFGGTPGDFTRNSQNRFEELYVIDISYEVVDDAGDSASQLFATGYGRVLLVKIVLTVVLMALAWRNRARWLPAAKSHRVTAYVSRSRSLTELAIMAVALTMAAALSVTG